MFNRSHLPSTCRLALCLALIASALLLPACGKSAAAGPIPVFQVQLGPGYTIHPAELTVPAGPFEIVVTNDDTQLPHSLVMLKSSTMQLAPGQSQRLIVKSGQEPLVGDYRMFCDVPGHQQLGQVGVVHVVPASSMASAQPNT